MAHTAARHSRSPGTTSKWRSLGEQRDIVPDRQGGDQGIHARQRDPSLPKLTQEIAGAGVVELVGPERPQPAPEAHHARGLRSAQAMPQLQFHRPAAEGGLAGQEPVDLRSPRLGASEEVDPRAGVDENVPDP
jgi:hypothetical protein